MSLTCYGSGPADEPKRQPEADRSCGLTERATTSKSSGKEWSERAVPRNWNCLKFKKNNFDPNCFEPNNCGFD